MASWRSGTVDWFDTCSGEGVVRDSKDGSSYYVHYSTILKGSDRRTIGKKSDKVSLKSGSTVRFQLLETIYSKQVSKVEEI